MSNYKKTVLGFLVCLLLLAVVTILKAGLGQPPDVGYLVPAGHLMLVFFQWGLLVLCAVLGVLHLGLKSREGGKNFTLYAMAVVLLGLAYFPTPPDGETDPRIYAGKLLIGVIALNVALLIFLRIRKRKTSISSHGVNQQSS